VKINKYIIIKVIITVSALVCVCDLCVLDCVSVGE